MAPSDTDSVSSCVTCGKKFGGRIFVSGTHSVHGYRSVGNTDPDHPMGQHWIAIYIDANSRGEYYDPTGRPPHESAYVNFMNKRCLHWTYNTVRVQEEGSTVCGFHCIFYLIHRCAGHSMTDVTSLLENTVEATGIVQRLVLLLVKHVL